MSIVGSVILQIQPTDPDYDLGYYYIGVYGSKMGPNSFSLSVAISDPSNIISKV